MSEGGDAKLPADDAKPKRSRLRRACLNCRRTHVACNEYRPCHECVVRNLQCTDVESARPARPEPEAVSSQPGGFPRFQGAAFAPSSLPRSTSAPLSNHPYPPRPPRGITMAELKAQARMQTPIPHSISADVRGPPAQQLIPSSRTYVFIPRPAGAAIAAGNVPRTGSPGYEVAISENLGGEVYPSPPRTPVWVEAADEGQRTRYLFHPLEGQQPLGQAPTLQQPLPQAQQPQQHHQATLMHGIYQQHHLHHHSPHHSPLMPHSPHLQHSASQPIPMAAAMPLSPPPVHWPHDSPEPVFTPFTPMPMDEDFHHP